MGILKDEYKVGMPATPFTTGGEAPLATPAQYKKLETNLPKKGQDEGFLRSLIKPVENYLKFLGEAGAQTYRTVTDPTLRKVRQGKELTQEDIAKISKMKTSFFVEPEKLKDTGTIIKTGAKATAGAAAFALPGGVSGSLARNLALGAGTGFLYGVSEDEATPESVALSTGVGAVAAPVLHAGGKVIKGLFQKILPKGAGATISAGTRVAREAVEQPFAEIPGEINLAFYRKIPKSVRKVLGIGGKDIVEKLKQGETVPAPPALTQYINQIRSGAISGTKRFREIALARAVQEPVKQTGIRGTIQGIKTGVDEAVKGLARQTSEVLDQQGNYGKLLSRLMRDTRDVSERRAGQAIYQIRDILSPLTSKTDDEALVKYLDQGIDPKNSTIKAVGDKVKVLFEEVADEAQRLGVQQKEIRGMGVVKKGFKKLENYFPHIFTDPDRFTQGEVRENIIKRMVASGQAVDRADATNILNKFLRKTSPRRFGSLEFGRVANIPGWEEDPMKALSIYFDRAYRRLEEIRRFGPNNERVFGGKIGARTVTGILQRLEGEGGDVDFATRAFNRIHGPVEEITTRKFRDVTLRGASSTQVISKLGLGQLTNLGQTLNTIVKFGVRPTWTGIKQATKKEGKDFALKSSAILDSVMRDALEQGGGSAGSKFLKYTGFSTVENLNRTVAANAGKRAAEDALQEVMEQGSKAGVAQRMLEKMGINVSKAIKSGLSEDDLLKAGQKASEWTQFRVGALDVPLYWSSPYGRFFTQFKNFAFKHAQFIKESVVDEAVKYHNFAPLRRLIIFSQLIGEPLADIKAAVRGKDITRSDIESVPQRVWENFATVGSVGIFYDMIQAAKYGRAVEFIAGPTASDIATLAETGYQAATGKPKPFAREVVRRIPIVGPAAKRLIPSDTAAKSTRIQPLPPLR